MYIFDIYKRIVSGDFLNFEGVGWDRDKNRIKHNVTEGECEGVFLNAPSLIGDGDKHSSNENCWATFGVTKLTNFLQLIYSRANLVDRTISRLW